MFELEIQKQHAAELIRRADAERLARQAVTARRAARRAARHGGRHSGGNTPEGPVSSLRSRFTRAA
ncbi:hypothetical protein [Streptomyces hypolithicus]